MSINADIESTVLFVLDQTSKIARQHSQREFDLLKIDITVEQWVLLKVIEEKKILSQTELAKATHRDPASITRTLDLLQKKGLLVRESIADNRRQHDIKLTAEGDKFVKQNMSLIKRLRAEAVKGFTTIEIETLITLLKKMQQNMT
jgi:MarR family transcriptional regulator, transcriptional regulator for hemolysin